MSEFAGEKKHANAAVEDNQGDALKGVKQPHPSEGFADKNNIFIFDHPLIQHKITMLRDKNTNTRDFRELVREISMLMAYEVTRDLPLEDVEVETPLVKTTSKLISGKKLALVPILRAGLGMVDGMLNLIPNAKVCSILQIWRPVAAPSWKEERWYGSMIIFSHQAALLPSANWN